MFQLVEWENCAGPSDQQECYQIGSSRQVRRKYASSSWRRGSESNRRIRLLQSPALPLGYPAASTANHSSVFQDRKANFSESGACQLRIQTNELRQSPLRPRPIKLGQLRPSQLPPVQCAPPAKPSSRRRAHSSRGLKIPAGVIIPVTNSGGVTSKPGLQAALVGLAVRT